MLLWITVPDQPGYAQLTANKVNFSDTVRQELARQPGIAVIRLLPPEWSPERPRIPRLGQKEALRAGLLVGAERVPRVRR